jgi:hypothetical protein
MTIRLTNQPVNHHLWRVLFLLAMWAGLELGATLHGHCQTIDCSHDTATIEYYDNLRILPGFITEISGTEVTFKIADKKQVVVRTFHLTDQTQFFTEKNLVAHPVDRAYFEKHKQECWVIRYCTHCHQIYKLVGVET